FGQQLSENVNPMWLLRILPNNVLCHVGIRHQFKGANACITNHCAGGMQAIAEAADTIRQGEADRVLAIGHDAPFEPELILQYHRLGLLSTDMVKPFDRGRDGTVIGEGAAALVLEADTDARARGARVLGEILGSGSVTEATGILDIRSDGDGITRAFELALDEAGLSPSEIGMIVAHANGTRASDLSEALGLKQLFGASMPPVTGFKWAYGHLLSASGILDAVMAVMALGQGTVPGIPSLRELDPELAPFPARSAHQEPRGDIAAIVCRGFGGMNVVLLIRAGAAGG
ncbi:MAG: 3-oxoacyl-acyl-carrier-protein synthase I, partial [bacterium]